MGKRRKSKAIKGEFHLPEPIIHRIQSFLTGKEAAQTTILSKSWHSAWLTRPNLNFDERDLNPVFSDDDFDYSDISISHYSDFSYSSDDSDSDSDSSDGGHKKFKKDEFLEVADMTIQRYEQSNLKIETLRLRISSLFWSSNSCNHARDLIVRALKIGVTHLCLQVGYDFVLPREVFESGNLVELSVEGGRITDEMVICHNLESLCLRKINIKSGIIAKIISSCPLIKKLSLSSIRAFDNRIVRLINLPKSHELIRCLVLCKMKFDISFLADLSSTFPSLEDLTLDTCCDVQEIGSRSLLRLSLIAPRSLKKVNVPRIQKFTFEGFEFPSMSFETTSREWESYINYKKPLNSKYLNGLKRILTQLGRSKINLTLGLHSSKSFIYELESIHGFPKHEVENVTMDLCKLPYALFVGLFRLCRPKFITNELDPENTSTSKITNIDFLCETLVRGMNGEFSHPSNFNHGVHGLEEVKMELFDEDVAAWRPRQLETKKDGSTSREQKQNVRFKLKWKP